MCRAAAAAAAAAAVAVAAAAAAVVVVVVLNIQAYLVAASRECFVKFTPVCAQYFYWIALISE
jgi:hypothetical protein